jgi:prevent-host-death family protein
MAATRFSEDIRSVSELKVRAAEIVEQVQRSRRPVLLTRRGRGVAVVLDLEEYERLVDRASLVEAVEAGARAAAEGDLHSNDEAMKILDSFGEQDA